ncbi:ABA4-like family protein [Paenibacillus chartarius]|uniref:ABA4-like family protein n=1 Tax=Paenibacillus chartarius TaxID=747481 RepID=A0ABV6DT48_9BACL
MYETLFSLSSPAMVFWILLIVLPFWRVTRWLANSAIFPIYLAALYAVGIIAAILSNGLGFVSDFNSSEGIIRLLSNPDFALIVWIHVLCFDQAVGHYVYRDNMEHRYVPLPLQSVLLFFVLMFGPVGFLCYLILREVRRRGKRSAG